MPVEALPEVATIVLESGPMFDDENVARAYGETFGREIAIAIAGLSVGLSALAAGYAEAKIGSAAVGATAENEDFFGRGLLLTVLPETMVIFAIVALILVLFL